MSDANSTAASTTKSASDAAAVTGGDDAAAANSTEIAINGTVTVDELDLNYGTLSLQGVEGSKAVLNVGELDITGGSGEANLVNMGGYATINGTGDGLDFSSATVTATGLQNEIIAKELTMGAVTVGDTDAATDDELILTYTKSLTLNGDVTINSAAALWLNNQTGKVTSFNASASATSGSVLVDVSNIKTNDGYLGLANGSFEVASVSGDGSSMAVGNLGGSIALENAVLTVTDNASTASGTFAVGGTDANIVVLNAQSTLDLSNVTSAASLTVSALAADTTDIVDATNSSKAALRLYDNSTVIVNQSALLTGISADASDATLVTGTAAAAGTWTKDTGAYFDGTSTLIISDLSSLAASGKAIALATANGIAADVIGSSANAIIKFASNKAGTNFLDVAISSSGETNISAVANLAVEGTVDATAASSTATGVQVTTQVTGAVEAAPTSSDDTNPTLYVGNGTSTNTVTIIAASDSDGFIANSAGAVQTSADAVVASGATLALAVQGSGSASVGDVTGTGTLAVNNAADAGTSATGTVNVNSIGVAYAAESGDTAQVNPSALAEVKAGTGILAVTTNAVTTDLTLLTSDATVNVGEELNILTSGGSITSENGQGTVTATDLVFGDASATNAAQTNSIVATKVTATNLTLEAGTADSATAGVLQVLSDEEGNAAELHVTGETSLNGGTLFIDPSIVYINGTQFTQDTTASSDASTNVTNGDFVLGAGSALYIGSTESNMATYATSSKTSSGSATVSLKDQTVGGATIALQDNNVAFFDGDLVIGKGFGATINPVLTSAQVAQWTDTAFSALAALSAAADDNTVAVTDGGVLVVNGALTFAASTGSSASATSHLTLEADAYSTYDSVADTVTYDYGKGGTLLFTGSSASVTVDQATLDDGIVAVASGNATLHVTAVSAAASTLTAEGTAFYIQSGSSLTLDYDGGSANASGTTGTGFATLSSTTGTATGTVTVDTTGTVADTDETAAEAAALANAQEKTNSSYVQGTLILDGKFALADDILVNAAVDSDGDEAGTLSIAEGSVLLITDSDDSDTASTGLYGFDTFANNGTVTLSGTAANGGESGHAYIVATDIVNSGTVNLLGYATLGTTTVQTEEITNAGTIYVSGSGNVITPKHGASSNVVGVLSQTSDGVISIAANGELEMRAEKFDLAGDINVGTSATLDIHNDDGWRSVADLSGVNFSNANQVSLFGMFKLSGNQLDSTATAADDGSLIWSSNGTTTGGSLSLSGEVFADSADLSLIDSTGNNGYNGLTASQWTRLIVSGTTTMDNVFNVDYLTVNTATLSADELVMSATTDSGNAIEVTTAL
ncbi:MAG: hypothetical protein IJ228_14085, partial [Succinivibrio sp.]|nr:hypothetical protein [Succinivibrio sp.]